MKLFFQFKPKELNSTFKNIKNKILGYRINSSKNFLKYFSSDSLSYLTIFSYILNALKPFKILIAAQLFISIVWAIDVSLRPYLLKVILDRLQQLLPAQAVSALGQPICLYISMSALMIIIYRLRSWLWLTINPYLKKHVTHTLMERLINHSHRLYQIHFSGSLANRLNDIVYGVTSALTIFIEQFFSNFIALIIAAFTMQQVNSKFTLGLTIWTTFFLFIAISMAERSKQLSDKTAEIRTSVMGQIVDILGNMMNVRLFNGKPYERIHLDNILQQSIQAEQKHEWYLIKMFFFQGVSFVLFQVICFYWLIAGLKNSTVTPGDFALILTINISIADCLGNLSSVVRQFAEVFGDMSQGLRIIHSAIEIEDKENATILIAKEGKIVFDKVKFHYKGIDPLFENKSVTIYPGQKVGLVGYSGSGKTTFVNLILRLYDVTDGRILIDGQDISLVTQQSLRQAIAVIPQDPSLFHRTLLENIRYGRIEATDEEVINAAKRAHAHSFIINQPEGYHTLAGERGVKISGGQRQRIAIARAILKNAPILILDEATSQLDSATEAQIQQSLWELMQNKTTIAIAHRLSTLLHMDRILVFEKGKIIQDGCHEELINKEGLYKTLWQSQVGGIIPRDRKVA